MKKARNRQWTVRHRWNDFEKKLIPEAHWEVDFSSMSDEYTPEEISAEDLFSRWTEEVGKKYEDGLVGIYWMYSFRSADGCSDGPYHMPGQHNPWGLDVGKDFRESYYWPEDEDGNLLNWLELPVADMQWNADWTDKGGFIQEVTKWKPSVLQPYVYLPSLTQG